MIVVDASVLVGVVAEDNDAADDIRARLAGRRLFAPEVLDLEVISALRRARRARRIAGDRALRALAELAFLPVSRVSHTMLLDRIWRLRDNLTAYDAAYVALAGVLDAPVYTRDAKLARAPGLGCEVMLIS
ncbi:MAG TPA: type II toxin-antitoxin system VapC family toxin [Conexibacter sp.]|nr:type II toxin-antitoxin system VapC family toxin [Conexibacter sp.]